MCRGIKKCIAMLASIEKVDVLGVYCTFKVSSSDSSEKLESASESNFDKERKKTGLSCRHCLLNSSIYSKHCFTQQHLPFSY